MKTTVVISESLLKRAKAYAKKKGKTLKNLIEEGLSLAISREEQTASYELPDCAYGSAKAKDPLEGYSWSDLRNEIYDRPTSTTKRKKAS